MVNLIIIHLFIHVNILITFITLCESYLLNSYYIHNFLFTSFIMYNTQYFPVVFHTCSLSMSMQYSCIFSAVAPVVLVRGAFLHVFDRSRISNELALLKYCIQLHCRSQNILN